MIYNVIFIAKCLGVSFIPLAAWMAIVFFYEAATEDFYTLNFWGYKVPFWLMAFILVLLSIDTSVYIVLTS
jgi:hypothetical protein